MIEIVDPRGRVIRRSRNLRGILDHARRTWIEEATASPAQEGKGVLQVIFGDGSTCATEFASYQVLVWWLCSRRSWAGVRRIGNAPLF